MTSGARSLSTAGGGGGVVGYQKVAGGRIRPSFHGPGKLKPESADRPRRALTASPYRHWADVEDDQEPQSPSGFGGTQVSGDEVYAAIAVDEEDLAGSEGSMHGGWRSTEGGVSGMLKGLLSSRTFHSFVAVLIITNAVVIGLETDQSVGSPELWEAVENILLLMFTIELTLRVLVFGPASFFDITSSDFTWNVFDAGLVSLGVMDCLVGLLRRENNKGSDIATVFRIFRLLRILRIFRLIRFLKQLYILTYGFALASLAVFWVTILMTAALYVCAIVLVRTYGRLPEEDPEHDFFQSHYGDILNALFTLFQLMMQPNLMEYKGMLLRRPFLMMFLVIFVIFGSFGMIALLTGVITEAMFEKNVLRLQENQLEREASRRYIGDMCANFFRQIKTNENGEASREELSQLLPRVQDMFRNLNVQYVKSDLMHMLDVMDTDGSGAINKTEFCRGLLHVAQHGEDLQPVLMMELQQDAISFMKKKVDRLEATVDRMEKANQEVLKVLQTLARGQGAQQAAHGASPADASNGGGAPRAAAPLGVASTQDLRDVVLRVEHNTNQLQGDMFSMGTRLEELLSDAHAERLEASMAELQVRRRCMEFESQVSTRLSGYEEAAQHAKRAAEEVGNQVAALATQVQALTSTLKPQ